MKSLESDTYYIMGKLAGALMFNGLEEVVADIKAKQFDRGFVSGLHAALGEILERTKEVPNAEDD